MAARQVTVIVPPELADGYRLAGVQVTVADSATAAARVLDHMLGPHERPAIVAVHALYLGGLGEDWRRRLARLDDVLVIALPEGRERGSKRAQDGESLRDLLARAVGYEFTFDPEGSTG